MSARTNEAPGPDAASKLDAARRVLAVAEAEVGVRTRLDRSAGSALAAVGAVPGPVPAESSSGPAGVAGDIDPERSFDVPAVLAPLFPTGLRRGSAVQVIGGTSVLLSLAACAVARGAWCGVVDLPDLGLAAAAELGVPLERTVVVPRTGPDAAAVLGAVVDGVDVVVLGRTTALADAERRTIASRVRVREAVLLTTSPWPGADVLLEVVPRAWHGIGQGSGMLQAGELTITAHHRRSGRPVTVHALLGARGWEPVPETSGAVARLRPAATADLQWRGTGPVVAGVGSAYDQVHADLAETSKNGPDGGAAVASRGDLVRAG